MGISKAIDELRRTRLTLANDTRSALDWVRELKSGKIESFTTQEALLDDLEELLESIIENS
ncbi:hypothetical protein [Psychrobacillus sp.]|uniref:hypothetical protein n=1 Tax=Psychrobacillus sp. TaxID=1871623 RepID=UPI0028BD59C3|nr:hypothetical protein [Psychrobacillus sp.]